MTLEGATCLVTGASRGIGRELSTHLAEAGAFVFAGVRDETALSDRWPERVTALLLDVTDAESVQTAVRAAGAIDVLVNNAGFLVSGAVEDVRDEDLAMQYEINLFAPWRLCRLVLPGMRERGRGAIVNLCSIGGEVPFAGYGAYRSSKFALRCLSWTLHLEVSHFGIRVLNVEPGAVATGFADNALRRGQDETSPYAEMHRSANHTYRIIAPQKIDAAEVARDIVRELTDDTGVVDLVIGDDARRLAELWRSDARRYERELVESFGFDWHAV